ncbi:MAG: type II toxin-antitoxin system RelE/ParE family toxin [Amaricoccus sp.]|uniref:type II toxin-antitoxin system RelE/ParE family toxin n=1 Tax=Amaricoccus sp. TaxID=1872485 RepID=UPI0039E6CC5C
MILRTLMETEEFSEWLRSLRDDRARARIAVRLDRAREGNLGRVEPVGEGVSELKIDYGPGYRVYLKEHGRVLVVLLCGGDKSSQKRDIRRAKKIAKEYGL